ncbi:hypothetical protein COO60DRAFT_881687 [Scenedesmus sp. NREL 46B-D3]|nr:hypothetical protein COO60DRAFT_881687 [Scenedesmus sp. NREL 46B-D3]
MLGRGSRHGTSSSRAAAEGAAPAQPAAGRPVPETLARCSSPAARPELAQQLKEHYMDVCESWKTEQQLPVVYDPGYNITLFGLEKMHPFDSCKFSKVVAGLRTNGIISNNSQLVTPLPATLIALQSIHSPAYLQQLHTSSLKVAQVTELAPLAMLPHFLVQRKVLQPMRLHVGGTVLAAALAVTHGWAVNVGGGMHHAHSEDGAGWCPYADITLAVQRIRAASAGSVSRVMVIDLDVHQGNGVERDKLAAGDADMYILDMYNGHTFPLDTPAKAAINAKVELEPGTADEQYLSELHSLLAKAAAEFPQPHLIIYNAGTDILAGDPLGRLSVSPAGVQQRDAAVFAFAEQQGAPVAMLLSGGYTRASAGVIVDSLTALLRGLASKLGALGDASRCDN